MDEKRPNKSEWRKLADALANKIEIVREAREMLERCDKRVAKSDEEVRDEEG